jgi:hypothetical protein
MSIKSLRQEFIDSVKVSEIKTDISGVVSGTSLVEDVPPSLAPVVTGSAGVEVDNTDLLYTNGILTTVNEYVTEVLYRKTTLSYTNGVLTSTNVKTYENDGVTVDSEYNETLTYTNGILTDVTRVSV